MNVIFDDKKDICKNLQSAIRGWKPFALVDEILMGLAIGLVSLLKNLFIALRLVWFFCHFSFAFCERALHLCY